MSTARWLDSLTPPSAAQARASLQATGAQVWAGYVVRTDAAWSAAQAMAVASVGCRVVPIIVPLAGQDLGALAATAHPRLALWPTLPRRWLVWDLEGGDGWTVQTACNAWPTIRSVTAGIGRVPVLYMPASWLAALATRRDLDPMPSAVWAANWVPGGWPGSPAQIPGMPDAIWSHPGQRAWQWRDALDAAGFQVDATISDLPMDAPAPAPVPAPTPTTPDLPSGTYLVPAGVTIIVP